MGIDFITPIEKRGDYYFKREDVYVPYDFSPANGSKLRQCQLLIKKNAEAAKNGIVTGTSILSPQAVIAASVAKQINVPCDIFYGGTRQELLETKKYPSIAKKLGANISIVSKMAYTSVLTSKAEEYATINGRFNIRYGFDLRNNLDVFIGSVATQTQNIPNEAKILVVTVGSAITLIGILCGLAMYENNIEKVFAIGCAPNRINKIQDYANMIYFEKGIVLPIGKLKYIDAFNNIKGYKYENTMKEEYNGIVFHPRYEAKSFCWLRQQNLSKCLFWITGKDI